jgi:hypothetical protein
LASRRLYTIYIIEGSLVWDDPKLPGNSEEVPVSEWSVVDDSIPTVKSSLYLTGKKTKKENKKN